MRRGAPLQGHSAWQACQGGAQHGQRSAAGRRLLGCSSAVGEQKALRGVGVGLGAGGCLGGLHHLPLHQGPLNERGRLRQSGSLVPNVALLQTLDLGRGARSGARAG